MKLNTLSQALVRAFLLGAVTITCVSNVLAASTGKFILTALEVPDIQRGAGLALVLQTPGGKTYLYDTGNGYPTKTNASGWASDHNTGRDIVAPFLKTIGVKELDGVLISHAHYDHFGGLLWLVDNIPIRKLIDSGYVFPGQSSVDYSGELGDYNKLREKFKQRGAYQEAHTGDTLGLDDQLSIEVIAPPKEFFTEPRPETRPKSDPPAHYLVNANSLGIRIQHGSVVFYLPGDIQSEDINQSLLPSVDKAKLKCNILVAPGHGIHFTREFAEATRPEVSIASVFPRYARGLKSTPMLKAVGAKTYITGLNGRVQVVSDGVKYSVTAERETTGASPSKTSGLNANEQRDGVLITENGKNVLFYQRTPKSLDGKLARSNYIHPLYDLDGKVLTEDFPKDHLHHRGVFWAWHQIKIGDKDLGDGWAIKDFSQDVTDLKISNPGPQSLRLTATVLWKSPRWLDVAGKEKPFVRETTAIEIHSASPTARAIDFDIHLEALEDGFRIGGSTDEKGYSGFSPRLKFPRDLRFTGEKGLVEPQNAAVQAGPWVDFSGKFGDTDEISGVAMLSHPSLPVFPPPWVLRNKASMQNAAYPGREAVPLTREKPLDLRYRLVIHKGDEKQAGIAQLQDEYGREPR